MMLHVDRVVVGLRKTTGDRLAEREEPIQQRRPEERIVDKIVTDAVDVGVHHQGVDKAEDEHDPERRVRVEKEEGEKIREVKEARESRESIPARVRKYL